MANDKIRQVAEGEQYQGVDEEVVYTISTTKWGGSPSGVSVAVYSVSGSTYTDVKSTVMPSGSPSVSGDVITLPPLKALTQGTIYRIEVKFTAGGNVLEPYVIIKAQR